MSIGKKIGGGFCVAILVALIEGLVAYRAMHTSAEISEQIAEDTLPRMVQYSEIQNDILLAAYQVRIMYAQRNEKQVPVVQRHINQARERLKKVAELNAKYPDKTTTDFLDSFAKTLQDYESLVVKGKDLIVGVQKANDDMIKGGEDAQKAAEDLLAMMGGRIKGQINNSDNPRSLERYIEALVEGIHLVCRISDLCNALLIAERSDDIQLFANLRNQFPEIAKGISALDEAMLTQQGRTMTQKALEAYERFSHFGQQVSLIQVDRTTVDTQTRNAFQTLLEEATAIMNTTNDRTQKMINEADAMLQNGTLTILILAIGSLLLCSLIAFFVTRMITKPISETQAFAEEVASGHLDRELAVQTTDEVGKLADSLRAMVAALNENIREAHEKSELAQKATDAAQTAQAKAEEATRRAEAAKREGMLAAAGQLEGMVEIISSASTQLSAQIEQSDRGATESATRLSEAATAMNEMNATVQEVARNAGSASQASADTKHKAEAGEHVVRQVVASIGDVQEVSMRLKEDMAQLNERAQDINRIMGVISDIADQTNLLALNAAIEAARAGEAGRGFAVVADEVRKLAEKTMTSTLDVSNAIRAIQESTDKSMDAMDNAVQKISEATVLANQSGAALEEIVSTVDATSDQVQAIAAASEEQSAASEEINRSIIEVNDMSRMTADAMNEANQAVADLANQAQRLTALIAEMKNS